MQQHSPNKHCGVLVLSKAPLKSSWEVRNADINGCSINAMSCINMLTENRPYLLLAVIGRFQEKVED